MSAAVAFCLSAAGQSSTVGNQMLTQTTASLKGLADQVVTLIQVLMGLGGMVVLVMIIFKVVKGDNQAAEKLAWWIFGLTIGFVLLVVLKNVALKG